MTATVFSSASRRPAPRQPLSRNAMIALAVVGLHVAFIWALQSGLLMRAAEVIVPAEILVQFVNPPAPKVEPVPPAPPTPAVPKKVVPKAPVMPQPRPLAIPDPAPSPNAPTGVVTPPLPPAPVALAPAAPPAPPAPPAVQLPSSDADYLHNPKPPYPILSKRLREQGTVMVRVLVGVDGQVKKANILKSSGFDRLDQAAAKGVLSWRFVPGKRGGVPQEMWAEVPISFVMDDF
ncbi:energy transducer TonB [Polaromonas aquatica]|uniref:energy transducer TonB n=1 Tax=Polaromonas aquatica TaxID=332657 RepID=UPI003D647C8D